MGYMAVFLVISVLILIHEFGHFLAAKTVGISIRQFSIGYGPRLFGFFYKGTEYRISLFPVGGYVMPELEELDDYFRISTRKRILFALAGPMANIMAAWAALVTMNVLEQGINTKTILILPMIQLWDMTVQFLVSVPAIISHPQHLSGVVGLVAHGKQVGLDLMRLLTLTVLLNINLAILNLLPILPLDGGKILIDIMDRLRMPVKKFYVPVAVTGWVALLLLMVYVTVNDVSNLLVCA